MAATLVFFTSRRNVGGGFRIDRARRRLSLRCSAFRNRSGAATAGADMHLLHLQDDGLCAPDRARVAVPAGPWRRRIDRVSLQLRHRATPVLQALRREIVLRAALASAWLQRQCALPR